MTVISRTDVNTKFKEESTVTGLVLFSGGLDSILACKVLQEQSVRVIALKFITPFFGYDLKKREEAARARLFDKYGIDVRIIDITEPYLSMLKKPAHGYGRYFNPCIDCKILMIRKAVEMLDRFDAQFVATGEVLGQRPMSQRRDAMRIIERDSGADGVLLRPLCAKHLPLTPMEEKGLVDRSRLLNLAGRGRKEQMALAERYGIRDYPTPAGGCVLADPIPSERLKKMFDLWPDITANDCLLAQTGRHFLLPDGSLLVVGRKKEENIKMSSLKQAGDILINATHGPGPTGLWRKAKGMELNFLAGGIVGR